MTRRSRVAALVAVTALALAACASNDAKKSDITNAMTDAGLEDVQAECIADGIWDEYGDDQDVINDIASAAEVDEFPEGTEQTVNEVLDDCLGNSPSGDTDDTTETTEAGDGGSGDTTTTSEG
jgi:hypothetical protein